MSKKFTFQAETSQVLKLLTHSVYSDKEVFLRELISNASDAIDKARLYSVTDTEYLGDDSDFFINISFDPQKKTLTISDNGVGMNKEDVKKLIGTIAKSGTAELLEKLKESKDENHNLIGQFGIGFYSSFLVSDRVEIQTKTKNDTAVSWVSTGESDYEIGEGKRETRGTDVILHIEKDAEKFLDSAILKGLIVKYSNYISTPIRMKKEDEKGEKTEEWEVVNDMQALWSKNKKDVTDEQYSAFYKGRLGGIDDPFVSVHVRTEGAISYSGIIFIPSKQLFFLPESDQDYGPRLYIQKVLIKEKTKEILPVWLRFTAGVVETSDIPLNISREMLQNNVVLWKIQSSLVKKVIDELTKKQKSDPETYKEFFKNYGKYIKEGVYYDREKAQDIAKLLLFSTNKNSEMITLEKYIEQIKESEEIFYITGNSRAEILSSPYLKHYEEKKIPVLIMDQPIDEWVTQALTEFSGKKLVNITTKNLEEEKTEEEKKADKKYDSFIEFVKNTIGKEKIESVQISHNGGENPGLIMTSDGVSARMETIMKSMQQFAPQSKKNLILDMDNRLVGKMFDIYTTDLKSPELQEYISYIYDQAIILAGGSIEDMNGFITRVNSFLRK